MTGHMLGQPLHPHAVSWDNEGTRTAPRRCANTVDPRGLDDQPAKEVIAVAQSLPPVSPPVSTTPHDRYAERMARADGCPECVTNYETPSSAWSTVDGFLANYTCQTCGHAWTTSWGVC